VILLNAAIKRNPVFWLMWILPGCAVLAGFTTLAIAMHQADRALPALYHWEGDLLDADFDRARTAHRLGLAGELEFVSGSCRLTLHGADAPALQLMLTNGIDAHQDRLVTLTRGADGVYHARCAPLAPGKWRIALQDAASTWSLRTQLDEAATRVELRARTPDGPGA
jgi:hypothetical protein